MYITRSAIRFLTQKEILDSSKLGYSAEIWLSHRRRRNGPAGDYTKQLNQDIMRYYVTKFLKLYDRFLRLLSITIKINKLIQNLFNTSQTTQRNIPQDSDLGKPCSFP